MKRVCSWCGKSLGEKPAEGADDDLVTHGICETCMLRLFAQQGMPLRDFLDRFGVPIVVVDRDGVVTSANKRALESLGKDIDDVSGQKGGDVFECSYAHLPEGCGKTTHCSGCTVRRAVMETHETGTAIRRRPAFLDRQSPDGTKRLELLISTERAGSVVLLKIERMGPA
jgi:PAS domain-containing protein